MKTISNECFFAWVETEIEEGRSVRFRVKGNSMQPLLRDGLDEVVLYSCKADELRRLDVVLFRYRGRHILHRIIGKEGDRFILQGDGVCTFHEECMAEDIVGIVKQVHYSSGKVVPVSSFRWRMKSLWWRKLGWFRKIALRSLPLLSYSFHTSR